MSIPFEGRVAIVTGAGAGLGRAYALELARRGARVVVNDLGSTRDGTGHSDCAQTVVDEIVAAGGEAIADSGSVCDFAQMATMVASARERWGGVHILINNAGILRDKSFANMAPDDFEQVVRVHLIGSAFATKACWETMRAQNYGRVLMTTSSSGLFGNFGQANYGAAKMGVVGLARTLYLEGAKHDIRVNTLAPVAATRMTAEIFPEQTFAQFAPEYVVPAALFLVSQEAPSNTIVGAGAGGYHAAFVTVNRGVVLPPQQRTVEGFAARWAEISANRDGFAPASAPEQTQAILDLLEHDAGG